MIPPRSSTGVLRRRALIIAAVLVASGLAIGIAVAMSKTPPPDLRMKTEFPEHYDTHEETLGAIAYDGLAKCLGIFNPTAKPTRDGIVSSEPPTLRSILAANPLGDSRYAIEGTPTPPKSQPRYPLPTYRSGTCSYDYWADLWQTRVTVTNRDPIPIPDADGANYSFILTPVRLDSNASLFMLSGTSPFASELVLTHELFPEGNYRPTARLERNTTAPIFVENNTFSFLFEFHAPASEDEVMLLAIPIRWDGATPRAVRPHEVEFTALHKMRPEHAALVLSDNSVPAPRNLADVPKVSGGNVRTFSATSLDEVFAKTREDDSAETKASQDLEAMSSTAFLTYEAVEPRAKAGKTKLVQATIPPSRERTIQLEVREGVRATSASVTHAWTTGPGNPKLTVRLSHETAPLAKPAAEAARVTAAVTQLGADGAVIAKSVADGTTADDAVRIAARGLSGRAQLAELSATQAAANEADALARSAQRYLTGAAGLEAGWYLVKASHAKDPLTRLAYENRAANTALTGLLMLTGEGAIAVAVVSLAEWGAHKIGAPELGVLIHNAVEDVGGLITGKPTTHGAQGAAQAAVPHLRAYAADHQAAILPQAAERQTPTSLAVAVVAIALAAAVLGRRRL